jgi:hypothetical protein
VQGVDIHITLPLEITFAPAGSLFIVIVIGLCSNRGREPQEFKTKTRNNNAIACSRGRRFVI